MKMHIMNSRSSNSINQYDVKTDGITTDLLREGETVIRMTEDGADLSVEIPGKSRIYLSSLEAEYLVTALLAHQREVMGYEVTIEEKAV